MQAEANTRVATRSSRRARALLAVAGLGLGSVSILFAFGAEPAGPRDRVPRDEGGVAPGSGLEAQGGEVRWAPLSGAEAARLRTEVVGLPPELEEASPTPVTEQQCYESFLGLARREPGALERLARPILEGTGPDCVRVALLRALHEAGSPDAAERFAWAIHSLADTSGPRGESVPSFAIRFLGQRAAGDACALRVLEQAALGERGRLAPVLRRRAVALLAEAAPPRELMNLAAQLAREGDGDLTAAAVAGLARNPHRATVAGTFAAFGAEPRLPPEEIER